MEHIIYYNQFKLRNNIFAYICKFCMKYTWNRQEPEFLSQFVDNKVLIGALGRMLQEERKKDNELVSNILEIFFCFSNFTQLHPILINSKISVCILTNDVILPLQ